MLARHNHLTTTNWNHSIHFGSDTETKDLAKDSFPRAPRHPEWQVMAAATNRTINFKSRRLGAVDDGGGKSNTTEAYQTSRCRRKRIEMLLPTWLGEEPAALPQLKSLLAPYPSDDM